MHQIYVEHYTECMETNCNDKTYVRTPFHRKIAQNKIRPCQQKCHTCQISHNLYMTVFQYFVTVNWLPKTPTQP